MAYYKCNECEAEFDEPDSYRECMGEFWGAPAYQTFYVCPVCKSEDFDEKREVSEDEN